MKQHLHFHKHLPSWPLLLEHTLSALILDFALFSWIHTTPKTNLYKMVIACTCKRSALLPHVADLA